MLYIVNTQNIFVFNHEKNKIEKYFIRIIFFFHIRGVHYKNIWFNNWLIFSPNVTWKLAVAFTVSIPLVIEELLVE